ncbi:C-type mannose receptor 2-like, partial [Huso huso]
SVSGVAIMEKLVLLMLLLAGICAVASDHFRKYHFVKDRKSWFDAQSYCREKHTDLATIESQEETEKLNISAGFTDAWIGLYYDKENWQWSNGDNVSYYNWKSILSCTSVDSNGEWVDSDCNNTKYSFICYNESCKDASCTKYHFVATAMNWSTAQTHCRDKYTDLATVHSQEEVKQLLDILNMDTNAWIGMYRDVSENWQWSNGDEVTYNTRRVKLFCATVSQDRDWTDSVCHDTKHFMCYDSRKDTRERYILIDQLKTWYEARQYCREHHTDLASVKNEDENKKIKEKTNGTAVWIGLFNNPWKWSDGGDNYTPQNWSEEQPDNYEGKEKCVMIRNKTNTLKLNDGSCSLKLPFFCYDCKEPCSVCVLV